jgi:hypothetical protein
MLQNDENLSQMHLPHKMISFLEKILNSMKKEFKSLKFKIEENTLILKETSKDLQQVLIEYLMLPLLLLNEDPEPCKNFSFQFLNILEENYFHLRDEWISDFLIPILNGNPSKTQITIHCYIASFIPKLQIFMLNELSSLMNSTLNEEIFEWILYGFYVPCLKSKSEEKRKLGKDVLTKYQKYLKSKNFEVKFKSKQIVPIELDERKPEYQLIASVIVSSLKNCESEWEETLNLDKVLKYLKKVNFLFKGDYIKGIGDENGKLLIQYFKKEKIPIILSIHESEIVYKIILKFFQILSTLISEDNWKENQRYERFLKYIINIYQELFKFLTIDKKYDSFEIYSSLLLNLFKIEIYQKQRRKMMKFLFSNRIIMDCNFQYFDKNFKSIIPFSINESLLSWTKFLINISEQDEIQKNNSKLNLIISEILKQTNWNTEMKSILCHLLLKPNFYSKLNEENILQLKFNSSIFQ